METKAIIDHVGRLVIGKVSSETATELVLYNPVLVDARPDQQGQLQVTSFPVLFFEFIDKGNRDKNNWTYNKANIVVSDVVLDERILSQYEKINTPQVDATVSKNPKVISINDL
jgi:phosphoribulokinase